MNSSPVPCKPHEHRWIPASLAPGDKPYHVCAICAWTDVNGVPGREPKR